MTKDHQPPMTTPLSAIPFEKALGLRVRNSLGLGGVVHSCKVDSRYFDDEPLGNITTVMWDNGKQFSHPHSFYSKVFVESIKQPEPVLGYHVKEIPRGVFGQSSKILEEVLELQDAEEQGAKLMALNELADIIGAVEGYLTAHYPAFALADLLQMKELTARAFSSGKRS